MSDIKYYTPSIEEFHVGFEYEDALDTACTMWQKRIFCVEDDNLWYMPGKIENEWVRVKILDREDIESLGWEYSDKTGLFQLNDLNGYKWEMLYESKSLAVGICLYKSRPFSGTIRNKSELAVIMKMIGVATTPTASN